MSVVAVDECAVDVEQDDALRGIGAAGSAGWSGHALDMGRSDAVH
jgi:hypothetical protein